MFDYNHSKLVMAWSAVLKTLAKKLPRAVMIARRHVLPLGPQALSKSFRDEAAPAHNLRATKSVSSAALGHPTKPGVSSISAVIARMVSALKRCEDR